MMMEEMAGQHLIMDVFSIFRTMTMNKNIISVRRITTWLNSTMPVPQQTRRFITVIDDVVAGDRCVISQLAGMAFFAAHEMLNTQRPSTRLFTHSICRHFAGVQRCTLERIRYRMEAIDR
jgi:hypothetical protein